MCGGFFNLITFCNMFLVNGNMFLKNGKLFLDKSQISCGFLKYAWCIFKATPVETSYQILKHITISLK